jgi:hypothetical protein
MKTKPFNQLTPAEAERLAILAEECAEVIQVVGKILRHGYASFHPDDATNTTNRELLERELGDVEAISGLMVHRGDIEASEVHTCSLQKLARLESGKYLHHQP